MATVIIGLAAVVLVAGSFVAWRWSRALTAVATGLEALRRGRKAHVVRSAAPGPVGRLVRSFNSAATEVQARAGAWSRTVSS